jgi:hypothetical protein
MHSPFTNRLSTDQINQSLILEHERSRRALWVQMATSYTASSNSHDPEGLWRWADYALKKYDETFPTPQQILKS